MNGDKIVVKINIHEFSVCEMISRVLVLFSLIVFVLFHSFPAMCGSSACEQKQTESGPASRSTSSEMCILLDLPIAYALLLWGNDFRVRVRPTHSSRFLSLRAVPPRPRPRNQVEPPIDLTLLRPSVRSFHSTFHSFAMLTTIACSARVKMLYDGYIHDF